MSRESNIPQEEEPPEEQEADIDESIEEPDEDENIASGDDADKEEMEPVKEDATSWRG